MLGWIEYLVAFAVFVASHSVPLRPAVRPSLEQATGRSGFVLLYSTASIAAIAWLIAAAGRAPHFPLWESAIWQNHVVILAMGIVCLILAFSMETPNPFSFGGGIRSFDPTRPGIVRWMRHPLLIALFSWPLAHIIPNGDLAHVPLIGSFAGFALFGTHIVDRRLRGRGGARWEDLRRHVLRAPSMTGPSNLSETVLRVMSAVLLFLLLLWLHPVLFGVDPLG